MTEEKDTIKAVPFAKDDDFYYLAVDGEVYLMPHDKMWVDISGWGWAYGSAEEVEDD